MPEPAQNCKTNDFALKKPLLLFHFITLTPSFLTIKNCFKGLSRYLCTSRLGYSIVRNCDKSFQKGLTVLLLF